MPDPIESANPTGPIRRRPSATIALPDHHPDERGDATTTDRIRRPVELDTRFDWMVALRHEGARHVRYGRPASILLIELRGLPPGATLDGVARTLAEVIRAEARETDRAVRVGATSFRVLLPETTGRAAGALVERLRSAFAAATAGTEDAVDLRIEVVTAGRRGTLEGALADAEARLGIGLPA